jgi:hypothetical protein
MVFKVDRDEFFLRIFLFFLRLVFFFTYIDQKKRKKKKKTHLRPTFSFKRPALLWIPIQFESAKVTESRQELVGAIESAQRA